MSSDLRTRFEEAVGPVDPAPADTAALWQRGRRQRRVKRAAPVLGVLVIVGLGIGAIATLAGGGTEREPLDGIEDGRATDAGWARIETGQVVADEDLVVAADGDVELVSRLLGHPGGPFLTDVRADGAILTLLQDPERGGIVVKHPGDEGWTRLGMPVPVLEDAGGFAVNTLQWGPDGRIYVNAMTPEAARRGMGLTLVVVLEEDGTVVGARENDDGLVTGFLFADGFAWQQQSSAPDRQRWQPVVELGGKVLPMPAQRAGDVEDDVAPDGLALRYVFHGEGGATFEALLDDGRDLTWSRDDDTGVGVWQQTPTGLRVGATTLERPGSGPLDWLTRTVEPAGVILHAVRGGGSIAAVHLPSEVIEQPGMLVNGAEAAIGGDDRVYWVSHTPDGPALFRYRHPIP